VPEREFRQIAAGQPVYIEVDAVTEASVVASVTRVSSIIDPETGTFKITIELDGTAEGIKPGMFGRMNIVYDKHENALQVPRSAIIETASDKFVFVVENEIGIRKTVETGFSGNGMVEVIFGLGDGENVITVGHVGLKNEASVVVVNSTDGDAE